MLCCKSHPLIIYGQFDGSGLGFLEICCSRDDRVLLLRSNQPYEPSVCLTTTIGDPFSQSFVKVGRIVDGEIWDPIAATATVAVAPT